MQNKDTPLHTAAYGGHIAVMTVLLDAGVDKEAHGNVSSGGALPSRGRTRASCFFTSCLPRCR